MSVPLTLAPVPVPSPATNSSTATPVSSTSSPNVTSPSGTVGSATSPTNTSTPSNNNNNNNNASAMVTSPGASPTASAGGPAGVKRKASRRANTAERRATHNAVERQRRETLNGRFLDLAALLPNLATVRRPSKSAIVNSSIALIHSHRRARAAAGRELRALEDEAQALRREVNEWRARTALPALQPPSRSAEFAALLHAGEGEDEGVAAEEERRAYLLAGEPAADDDDDDWGQQMQPASHVHASVPSPIHPGIVGLHMAAAGGMPGHPTAATAVGSQFLQAQAHAMSQHQQFQHQQSMIEEKMAQWNALQYAMQVQQQQHGQPISVGPNPRIGGSNLGMQRPDQPQWSATSQPPTLFARPVPIPSHLHHAQSSATATSPPFAFSPPNHATGNGGSPLDGSAGYGGSSVHSGGSPAHSPQATSGALHPNSPSTTPNTNNNSSNAHFVGSPSGSTPPATTSSGFDDTESESESKWGIVATHAHAQAQIMRGAAPGVNMSVVGGPGGFAAMGMGMVM